MSAYGQTVVWGMHIGRSLQDVRGLWLQRLGRCLSGRSKSHKAAARMALQRVWDSRREQLRSARAQSALEDVAARGGQSRLMTMQCSTL